jgi:hypothetical protein
VLFVSLAPFLREFDLGQGNGFGFGPNGNPFGQGECSWKWGNDEAGWNHFCEHVGPNNCHEGDDEQIQFVTALSNGVTVYRKESTKSQALGTLQECQTATLDCLKSFNGFYLIDFEGQKAFVSAGAVTVGVPSACVGVSPTSSVLPQDDFVFFYHTDHLGSTGYMTDGSGRITEHIEYIPFGETWIQSDLGMNLFPDYEFTGQELDTETGLYYYGARYYDPRTSVFEWGQSSFINFLAAEPIETTFPFPPAILSISSPNVLWLG